MNDLYKRKLSVYDNVDLNESFNAAKRLINEESNNRSDTEKEEVLTKNTIDSINNANLKQFNKNDNQLANNHQAINNQNIINSNDIKQLNGQNNYTQENKNRSTFFADNNDELTNSINLNNNIQISKDDNDLKNNEENEFKRQIKKTSS